jgi:hypothetical protein
MRPTLRISLTAIAAFVLGVTTWLVLASAAGAVKLYDGSSASDLSVSVPGSLSPADGAELPYPSSSIHLSWGAVAGASTSQLQVARVASSDVSCDANAFQADNLVVNLTTAENQWVPAMVAKADGADLWTGTYCWRVRTTGGGTSSWSSAHQFSRSWAAAPSGLQFYNDHDGPIPRTEADADFHVGSASSRNSGYLTWDGVAGAASYELQVGTSRSFSPSSIVATRTGIRDSKVLLLHLPDDTYYWRVRAISANGTEGGWSASDSAFTIKWQDPQWSAPGKLYPVDSASVSEMRIGWTPMPGASYYEYQIGTDGGCFWDSTAPETAPAAYGDWVKYPAVYETTNAADPTAEPRLRYTIDPSPDYCRLSKVGATTMNNWVTLGGAMDQEVFDNIGTDCYDEDSGAVLCEYADFPDAAVDNWGAVMQGISETTGSANDGARGEAYSIWWRVRPVYQLKPETESGWDVSKAAVVYGSWTRNRQSGANREHRFDIDMASLDFGFTGTRCEGTSNPSSECLEHVGSTMRADEAAGVADSGSLQVPVLTWRPFSGAGGYIVQIARDPLFNNMVKTVFEPGLKSHGYGFQQSFALGEGLPDNSEGTGYWWRVTPCDSTRPVPEADLTNCKPLYGMASAGLPMSEDADGYADAGVAQTFTKRSELQTRVSANFEGASPLLSWSRTGTAESDYAGWSAGLEGAEHYEIEMARDPFMNESKTTLKTTIPRIVPFAPGEKAGKTAELPDGIWYYRVRGIDRNGLAGSWSEIDSFNKRIAAPTVGVAGGGGTTGAGVAVSWSSVTGANDYTMQWSADPTFETGASSATTKQTSYRFPSSQTGTFYWRVRANVSGIEGQWSSVRSVTVVPRTKLRFGLSKALTYATEKVTLTGELSIAGTPRNGHLVQLQKKSVGCDGSGSYRQVAQATTGRKADDGIVNFPITVAENSCYRLVWAGDNGVTYSAPVPVKVAPKLTMKLKKSRVYRGQAFCVRMTSKVAISGRMRVQYRIGKSWRTTRSANVKRMKVRSQCATINQAGKFPVRVVFDRLAHPTKQWTQFETVTKTVGKVSIINRYSIRR